ncbi:MAG TPA: ATP-binding protein, partial [Blastocatellia bacterium]|nr:ATP-binding protein [Blastocatellia bacterium]
MLFDIPLDQVTEAHLQSLVTDSVAEDRQLEYKLTLPTKERVDRIEFLKDVSALGNTIGGDIIYGLKEGKDTSGNTVAVSVDGIVGADSDEVIRGLEDIMRNGINPRLIGVRIRPVALSAGSAVFIVRVPASWNAPHVIDYQKHWRFYHRGSAASYPMDVTELRNAMTSSNTLRQRLEEFRFRRLAQIADDPTLARTAKIVLHFQPLDSLRDGFEVDLSKGKLSSSNLILMNHDEQPETRPNFDGLLISVRKKTRTEETIWLGYIQIFRSGAIEEVDANSFSFKHEAWPEANLLRSSFLEGSIIRGVEKRLALLKDLDIQSPVQVHLSLLGMKGYLLWVDQKSDPFGTDASNQLAYLRAMP